MEAYKEEMYAGLLPGKLLDIPEAKPMLWSPQAKAVTLGVGAAVAAAFLCLALCTCWFLGLFEVVPVKQEGELPAFEEPEEDTALPAVVSREGSMSEEGGILVIY